jgi:tetratricopeptide (TPR) repeat protein
MRATSDRSKAARERATLAAILGFAAATRVLYLLVYRATDPLYGYLLHDAKRYHEWATALADGSPWESGAFYQAPLYPYLVSLVYRVFGAEPLAAYVLQSVFGLLLLFLVHRIARRIWGGTAALIATGLGALYGPLVFYESKLLPASLSVLLAALVLDRVQSADASRSLVAWTLVGGVLGAAALANPSFLLLALLVVGFILRDRSRAVRLRIARAAIVLICAGLVVLPATIRNLVVAREPVLISTNGGITFYQGNNPAARGVFSIPEGFSGSIFRQREESRRFAEAETGRPMSDADVSRFWGRKGLAFWAEGPARAVGLLTRKLLLALASREQPLEYNVHLDPNPARYAVAAPFALVLALATSRLWMRSRLSRVEAPLVLLLVAQTATMLLFFVAGRYRLPAMPALLVMAGAGGSWLCTRLGSGRRAAGAPLAVAIAVGLASFVYPFVADPELVASQQAVSSCDRADASFKTGNALGAIALYRRAIELDPSYPFAPLDLAKVLVSTGDLAEAERAIRDSLRIAPGLAEAHYDLGVLLYGDGRLDEAAASFAEAVLRNPTDPHAANNLLGTLLKLGRKEAAIEVWRTMKERNLTVDPPLESWIRALGP